jgi:methyltransferase (TIGR00027 family)
MQEPLIQNVSDTAFLVAGYRSLESKRSDALFRGPLAEKLIGDRGQAILKSIGQRAKFGIWSIVIRTVIIDEFINFAIKDGVDTIINLGAGLDTRPYRMSLPTSLRWIEVDIPHIIDWKTNLLLSEKPICKLERIGVDCRLFFEGNARKERAIW